jgi:Glycosyl transferases group 1
LHQRGISIYLHCFEYGRGRQPELLQYCKRVYYYSRKKAWNFRLPYIVSSRIQPELIKNLKADNHPVLLEGIHCTYYLYNGQLSKRKVLVRLHNVEYIYYRQLARAATNILQKIYFHVESLLLKRYEKRIASKASILTVTEKDRSIYKTVFGAKSIEFLPVFLPFDKVTSQPGHGTFCLYHGNLSVPENEKVVFWLLQNVFNKNNFHLVVAGKNPSDRLKKKIARARSVKLVENPSGELMNALIRDAHIHILPSVNSTGIKIKLLNALFNGRFVITDATSVDSTKLEPLCRIANNPSEYKKMIQELWEQPFSETDIEERKRILCTLYNNQNNAEELVKWL